MTVNKKTSSGHYSGEAIKSNKRFQMYCNFQILRLPCRPGVVTYLKNWVFTSESQRYVARGALETIGFFARFYPKFFLKTKFIRGANGIDLPYKGIYVPGLVSGVCRTTIFRDVWVMEMITNEQILLRCIKKDRPLIHCGIYFLIKEDIIVYIGQSVDIEKRVMTHCGKDGKDFDYYLIFPCEKSQLLEYERNFIERFYPIYNQDTQTVAQKAKIIEDNLLGKPAKTPQEQFVLGRLIDYPFHSDRLAVMQQIERTFFARFSCIKPIEMENGNS